METAALKILWCAVAHSFGLKENAVVQLPRPVDTKGCSFCLPPAFYGDCNIACRAWTPMPAGSCAHPGSHDPIRCCACHGVTESRSKDAQAMQAADVARSKTPSEGGRANAGAEGGTANADEFKDLTCTCAYHYHYAGHLCIDILHHHHDSDDNGGDSGGDGGRI